MHKRQRIEIKDQNLRQERLRVSNFSWLMLGKMCRKRLGLQNVEQLTAQICSAEGVIRYAIFIAEEASWILAAAGGKKMQYAEKKKKTSS